MTTWERILLAIALLSHFAQQDQILKAQQEANRWLALIGNKLSQ